MKNEAYKYRNQKMRKYFTLFLLFDEWSITIVNLHRSKFAVFPCFLYKRICNRPSTRSSWSGHVRYYRCIQCTLVYHPFPLDRIDSFLIGNTHTDWMLIIAWLHRMYAENSTSILSYINVLHAYYRSEFVLPAEYIGRVRAVNRVQGQEWLTVHVRMVGSSMVPMILRTNIRRSL